MNKRIFKATVLSLLFSSCSLVSAGENIKGGYELNNQLLNSRENINSGNKLKNQLLNASVSPQRIDYGIRTMQYPVNANKKLENNSSAGSKVAGLAIILGVGAASLEVGNQVFNGKSFFGNLLPTRDGKEDFKIDGNMYEKPVSQDACEISKLVNETNEFNDNSHNSCINESENVNSELQYNGSNYVYFDGSNKIIDGYYYYTDQFLKIRSDYNLVDAIKSKMRTQISNAWHQKLEEQYHYSRISGYSFSKPWKAFTSEWKYGDANSIGDFDFRIYFKPYFGSDEERVLYDSLDQRSLDMQISDALNKENNKNKLNNSLNNFGNTSFGSFEEFNSVDESMTTPDENDLPAIPADIEGINQFNYNDDFGEGLEEITNSLNSIGSNDNNNTSQIICD